MARYERHALLTATEVPIYFSFHRFISSLLSLTTSAALHKSPSTGKGPSHKIEGEHMVAWSNTKRQKLEGSSGEATKFTSGREIHLTFRDARNVSEDGELMYSTCH